MERVSLNEYLNAKNIWALRLLGYESFQKCRNIDQVENEYNLDKYAKLLACDFTNMEEYKIKEFENAALSQEDETFISFKDEIFRVKLSIGRRIFYQTIKDKVEKYSSEYVCELGCGYGFNLSYLDGKVYGGEYSRNAVGLAKKLGMEIYRFNYYNHEDYSIIKRNTTIFTVHSIEQIPDALCFIESLAVHKSKIDYVVNFEPSIIPERRSFLGLLRNKYIELNDYNRNLFSVLKAREDVEIVEYEQDLIGINPLNSANLIAWKFK